MSKKNLIIIVVSVGLFMFYACSQVIAQTDSRFSNVSWNGAEVSFKAAQEVKITGVSVIVGENEFSASNISNTAGDIKFPNGATARPGSSLLLKSDRTYIILKETAVNCEVSDVTGNPDKVRFYINNDTEKGIIVDVVLKK